jgi:uncharacterized protein (DUF1800 family)
MGQPDSQTAAAASPTSDPAWAWAPYVPDAQRPWTVRWAGHLYRRAGFGANWQELQAAVAAGPQRAVDRLLHPPGDLATFNADFDRYEAAAGNADSTDGLRGWWLRRMIETPQPLLEKMTLFWHSHFGISRARVGSSQLMSRLVQLQRRQALGNYREMLVTAFREPAMFQGLEAEANRKAVLNVNIARQLLDQYSLGTGHYDERDLRDTARAFTGWFVLRNELRFFEREFDDGPKTIAGQTGNWKAADAVRLVLQPVAAAEHVVRKLYRWLISETDEPDAERLAPLAGSFARDYDSGRVVETILRSNLFFSPVAYGRRVKSPVEFAVGLVRALESSVPTVRLGSDLVSLGQNLYHPPTTSGWAGGRHWINPATMVARHNLASALLAAGGPYEGKLNPAAVAQRHGHRERLAAADFLMELLFPGDVTPALRDALRKRLNTDAKADLTQTLREFVHAVVTQPEYQLC